MIYKSRHCRWLERNPLRRHLIARGTRTTSAVASMLGVSRQTMYLWMKGQVEPQIGSFTNMRIVTGITAEQWMEWLNDRPQVRARRS